MNFQTGFSQTNFALTILWHHIGGGFICVETMSFFWTMNNCTKHYTIQAHGIDYDQKCIDRKFVTATWAISVIKLASDVEVWAPSLFWKHVFMVSSQVAAWSLAFSNQVLDLSSLGFTVKGWKNAFLGPNMAPRKGYTYIHVEQIYIFLLENNLLDCQASFVITISSCYELNT